MSEAETPPSQEPTSVCVRVQTIDIDLTSPPEHPICLKLLLNGQLRQRINAVPIDRPLHWDDIKPIDARVTDRIQLHLHEYHASGRKLRIGTVTFGVHEIGHTSTELIVNDSTGIVPCSVKFVFLPQMAPYAPHSVHPSASTAIKRNTSMLGSMGKARDLANAILSIVQHVPELSVIAEVSFGLCSAAWQVLAKQERSDKLLADLVLGMGGLLPLVDVVKDQAKLKQLQTTIHQILRLMGEASRFVVDYQSDGAAVHVVRACNSATAQDQVNELLKQFKRLREDFDTGMAVQATSGIRAVLKNVNLDALKRLITPDAGYNPNASCLEGTRITVQNDINEWVDNPLSGSIYWLTGLPGCGKSAVAHSVCGRLRDRGYLAAAFFCKRDNEQLNKPENVMSTLAASLAFKWNLYGANLLDALRGDPQLTSSALATRFRSMVVDPIRSTNADSLPQPAVVVIDALDECGTVETRAQLAAHLIDLSVLAPWAKIIITSRPNHELQRSLRELGNLTRRDLFQEDRSSVTDDVEVLVRHRLEKLLDDDDELFGHKNWLTDGTTMRLAAQASGLFIWAQTACNAICNSLNPDKKIQDILSGEPSRDATNHLYSLYATILHEALSGAVGDTHIIKTCIAAIALTRTPLPDTILANLLEGRVELVELRSVVRRLGAVLYRDGSGAVHVSHESFSDFMLGDQCPADYRTDMGHENLLLGISCMNIMVRELRFNICDLEDSGLFNDEVTDLADRIQNRIPNHLAYSCFYWTNHLLAVETPKSASRDGQLIIGLLTQLLRGSRPFYWIEVLSLFNGLHVSEIALTSLKNWVQGLDHDVLEYAGELCNFVKAFHLPISRSTPHLYISSLAFACGEQDSFQALRNQFPNRAKVVQGQHLGELSRGGSRLLYHPGGLGDISYSPDGKLLATACWDKMLRVFDTTTGTALRCITHENPVTSVAFSPDGKHIVSGALDTVVRIWNAEDGTLAHSIRRDKTAWVYSVAFSSDGQRVALGSNDCTICVWNIRANTGTPDALHHSRPTRSIAFSPDSSYIVSGSEDGVVRIWDVHAKPSPPPQLLRGHSDQVWSVAYSPSGQYIASGSVDGTARIWDARSGTSLHTLVHPQGMTSVAFSADGQSLISGSRDGMIRFWGVHSGAPEIEPLWGHFNSVTSVASCWDGQYIASGSFDDTVRLWDLRTSITTPNPLRGHSKSVIAIAYSPDGRYIATGSADETVRVWDAHTSAPIGDPFLGHSAPVTSIAFSPNGQVLISGSQDKTLRFWNIHTGATIVDPLLHPSWVTLVAYSPDSRWIASGTADGTVRLWSAENGSSHLGPLQGHSGRVSYLAFSPDSQQVFSASVKRKKRLDLLARDVRTGTTMVGPLQRRFNCVRSVALSFDGQVAIAGASDGSIQSWDTRTGHLSFDLKKAHGGPVERIVFSPDNQRVVSVAGGLQVRHISTGEVALDSFRASSGPAVCAAFSPDGLRIAAGYGTGAVHVWDCSPDSGQGSERPEDFLISSLHIPRVPSHWLCHSMDYEGWVWDSNDKPLIWLPYVYRRQKKNQSQFAMSTTLTAHPVSFDLTKFKYGRDWVSIRDASFVDH